MCTLSLEFLGRGLWGLALEIPNRFCGGGSSCDVAFSVGIVKVDVVMGSWKDTLGGDGCVEEDEVAMSREARLP